MNQSFASGAPGSQKTLNSKLESQGPLRRLIRFVLASELSLLTRLACVCAGLSLVFMVLIVVVKIPLLLVLGVGVAHAFGIVGVLLFAAAVIKESLLYRPRSLAPKAGVIASSPPHEAPGEAPGEPPASE